MDKHIQHQVDNDSRCSAENGNTAEKQASPEEPFIANEKEGPQYYMNSGMN